MFITFVTEMGQLLTGTINSSVISQFPALTFKKDFLFFFFEIKTIKTEGSEDDK